MHHLLNAYFNTTPQIDSFNATHDVKRALKDSAILNGILTVFLPQATSGVTVLENDPAIVQEVKMLMASMAEDPKGTRPMRKSGTGHLSSHLRAAFLPRSVAIPIKDGRLFLGAWQEVWVFDFDDRVGRLEVKLHVVGEGEEKKK